MKKEIQYEFEEVEGFEGMMKMFKSDLKKANEYLEDLKNRLSELKLSSSIHKSIVGKIEELSTLYRECEEYLPELENKYNSIDESNDTISAFKEALDQYDVMVIKSNKVRNKLDKLVNNSIAMSSKFTKKKKNKGEIIEPTLGEDGFMKVQLFDKNGVGKWHNVHELVAQAHVPNPNGYKYVRHIDGNKLNNNANNLEWVESL